ncbi:MAG: riboflavin synthase [Candidatus Aenigmatarchaeota archaeon]
MPKIGLADTMFAKVDMASFAIKTIEENVEKIDIERYTVPGFKDLPVACKILFEKYNCDIVLAFGWVGGEPVDEVCAHEANQGIIQVQLITTKHILSCFVHTSESRDDEKKLYEIAKDRAIKHTENAIALLKGKTELTKYAGHGKRQGYDDEGSIEG